MTWKKLKLGEFCSIINGSTPKKSEKKFWKDGTIPWFTINDVRNQGKNIEFTEQFITKEGLEKSSLKILPVNTVLLCCTASIGVAAITKIELTTNQQFNGLVIKSDKVLPEYLYYQTITLKKKLLSLSGKTTIDFISVSKLKEILIPIPSLNEQKRIVAKLDKAFEKINKLEGVQINKISLFNQIKKSILSSIIIDELKKKEVKLKKLKEVVSYEKKNGQGSGLPYVGMEDISSDSMMLVNEVKVPLNTSNTFLFNSNHILYGRLRPYLKKILIPNFSGQCSTELFCIKPENFLDRKFLAYWLLTPEISDKINKTSTGTRMPRANMKDLLEFEIHLPELTQQKKIVKKIEGIVNEIELLISNSEILLENYKALKSSLLRQELQQENVA